MPDAKPVQSQGIDPASQEQIEELDHKAHDLFDSSHSWAVHARLGEKIAGVWEDFGEKVWAKRARRQADEDLETANGEEEQVYNLLILERILRDTQTAAGIAKLRAAAPQLRATLATLHKAVHDHVSELSDVRQQAEYLFHQLSDQLARPLGDRDTATALLRNLELYLKDVQQMAHINGSVREIWIEQADMLATVL